MFLLPTLWWIFGVLQFILSLSGLQCVVYCSDAAYRGTLKKKKASSLMPSSVLTNKVNMLRFG